jgi:hypothetical protein
MTPRMLNALFASLFVFTILLADLVWHRYRLAQYIQDLSQEER